MTPISSTAEDDLAWFRSPQNLGVIDPLTFAEEWFAGKDERDKVLALKKKALDELKISEQRRAPETLESADEFLSADSPSYQRLSNYGDFQSAGGVYPTPPDGVSSQQGRYYASLDAAGSTPSVVPGSTPFDNGQENSDITQGGAREHYDTGDPGDFAIGGEDGIYGDLDDDMMGMGDLTDADLSFFNNTNAEDLLDPLADSEELMIVNKSDGKGDNAEDENNEDIITDDNDKETTNNNDHGDEKAGKLSGLNKVGSDLRQQASSLEGTMGNIRKGAEFLTLAVQRSITTNNFRDSLHILSPPPSPRRIIDKLLPEARDISISRNSEGKNTELTIRAHSDSKAGKMLGSFDPVSFNRLLNSFDNKYTSKGRFNFENRPLNDKEASCIPKIGLPKRVTRRKAFVMDDEEYNGQGTRLPQSPTQNSNDNGKNFNGHSDFGKSSDESDNDDTSYTTGDDFLDEPLHGIKINGLVDADGDTIMSLSAPNETLDALEALSDESLSNTQRTVLAGLEEMPYDHSTPHLHDDYEPFLDLANKDFISVAQIVADQIISGTLAPLGDFKYSIEPFEDGLVSSSPCTAGYAGSEADASLETTGAVEERPTRRDAANGDNFLLKSKVTAHQRRQNNASEIDLNDMSVIKLMPPHLRLERAEVSMELLPPAIPFWETFGLSPYGKAKDILSFYVYPPGQGVEEAVMVFSERIGAAYESCRLGKHSPGDVAGISRGLVPINIPESGSKDLDLTFVMEAISGKMIQLGKQLSQIIAERLNLVVYVMNPFSQAGVLVDIGTAFWRLWRAYIQSPRIQNSKMVNELVLQNIPISFIASKTSIVVPPPQHYTRLAFEVYERCALMNPSYLHPSQSFQSSPLLTLAEPPPKSIDFKLTTMPSYSLLHETPCIHVAYSRGLDGRWISAAWSDNWGKSQDAASYCLGRRSSILSRSFEDIAREIWETTMDIIRSKSAKWRVLLIKTGSMDREEIEGWERLRRTTDSDQMALVLLSADLSPNLKRDSVLPLLSPNATSQPGALYSTPASTPQPNTQSPDQFGNATTPASGPANASTPIDAPLEPDADATLVDVTDETWAALAPDHGQNYGGDLETDSKRPTGYVIKRGGTRDSDAPVAMGVHLLRTESPSGPTLAEILGMYRGLGSLARLKGVAHPIRSAVPWHVATAVKAQEGLSYIM